MIDSLYCAAESILQLPILKRLGNEPTFIQQRAAAIGSMVMHTNTLSPTYYEWISYFSPPPVRSGLQSLQAGFPQIRDIYDMQGGISEYEAPADSPFSRLS